ncbi:Phr family secreted Rap phosphatase inhibitor [Bacillus thuringiensis]
MKKMKIILMGIMTMGIMALGLHSPMIENSQQAKYTTVSYADGNTG